MDRPLTQLEIQILRELPANASEVSKRLNKVQPQIYKSLNRLIELGVVYKDEHKQYHVEDGVQVPMPTELHVLPEWTQAIIGRLDELDAETRDQLVWENKQETVETNINEAFKEALRFVILFDMLHEYKDGKRKDGPEKQPTVANKLPECKRRHITEEDEALIIKGRLAMEAENND